MKTTPLRTASTFRPFQPSAFRLSGLLLLLLLPLRADITERPDTQGDAFRVVSANIRQLYGTSETNNDANDPDSWHGKRDAICLEVLLAQKAHIYAFQEFRRGTAAETNQLDFLLRGMPGFDWFTLRNAYWGNTILYSTERFEFLGGDGFWLSETPMIDNSVSWDATANRFVNWVVLRDKKTNRALIFWNTHLDAVTKYPRERQVQLIVDSAALQPGSVAQILTGDLNAYHGESPSTLDTPGVDDIDTITRVLNAGWRDTYEATHPGSFNPERTGHSFTGAPEGGGKIDWVFMRGPLKTTRSEIIKDYKLIDGRNHYPADHYFISADLEFDTTQTITDPIHTPVKYRELDQPAGLALDAAGNLLIADEYGNTIKRLEAPASGTSRLSAFAGIGGAGLLDHDRGSLALFNQPRSLALQDGFVYVADSGNKVLRVIDADTTAVSLYAGAPAHGPALAADGDLETARFALPAAVAIAPDGTIYVADSGAHAIRKIATDGAVTTLAGELGTPGATNGAGPLARFNEPLGLALDSTAQNLYVADTASHTIRKIDLATATVSTLAGQPGVSGTADGAATAARFNSPAALAVVGGIVYVADTASHTIRAVDAATGATTLVAGTPGKETPIGYGAVFDGAPAEALFSYPSGLVADATGQNLYVADTGNGTIRRINLAAGAVTSTPLAVEGAETRTGGGSNASGQISGEEANVNRGPTGSSSGGGGALSPWCLLAAALLLFARAKPRRV